MKIALPLLALATVAAATTAHAQAPKLEVRVCPEAVARPYPLDSLRSVQSLLLQNAALVNRSGPPVEVTAVEIDLLRAGEVVDRRSLTGTAAVTAFVRTGQAIKMQGLLDQAPFQFCDGRLLDGATFTDSATVAPGQALLVFQQAFAWKGVRDEARITFRGTTAGQPVSASASVKLDGAVTKTAFRWPLKSGLWTAGAGASFHTAHRWAVPEEFALDILTFGPNGRSYRTTGARHEDFYAYGAEVVAAADGKVVGLITGGRELPPLLRAAGETFAAYMARVMGQQAENLKGGVPGAIGDGVIIDHGNSEYSVYAHLKPSSITVREGQAVKAGETIGRLGSSGNSTEAHLHFQVCDRPTALSCAGLIPNFQGLEIINSDGPRPLQSGDVVRVD